MVNYFDRLLRIITHRLKNKRTLIFHDLPKGTIGSQVINVDKFLRYRPGLTDFIITVPKNTTVKISPGSTSCLKIEKANKGDSLVVHNNGVLDLRLITTEYSKG